MGKGEIILHGPELPFELFQGSLSEFVISKIKSHPKDNIFQINADSGEELTFHEILRLSIEIGEGLVKNGLKFGDVVALAGRNSTQLHSSALGVLFSGGVFASVEPEMRIFEMQLLYEQVQPKYVFCEHQIENAVAECLKNMKSNAKIVIIDAPANYKTKNLRFEDLLVKVDIVTYTPRPIPNPSEDIALIVCSSGSSGIPKGVKISHRGMIFQLQSWEYTVTPVDFTRTFFQTSHFFWISGILFVFMSVIFGQKRIYIREINETNMLKAIDTYKPYSTMIPPAEVLSLLNFPDLKKYDVSSIEYILTGGSSLPQTVIDRLGEFSDHVKLFQGYGMTELSGVVTIFNADEKYVRSVGNLNYGVSLKCVDISTGESLGPNSIGEFLFKSIGIMKGYIGNEEATKAAIDEDGWYHSGDLGYYDEDERIYIVDRIKEVIKFRNLQISPAEVEAFIESIPGVKEAGVMGISNEKDTYHPMALVVRKNGSSITAQEIMEAVKNNLSSYKQLRAGVFFVESLPRTGTGKIKRVQLKELGKKLYEGSRN